MHLISMKFPDFHGDSSLFRGMNEFSDYAIEQLVQRPSNPANIEEIFQYIEFLMVNGDEDTQTAVATCFLENILNVTPSQIDPKCFLLYLGPQSKEYCRAWDSFTGVQTEGL